MGRYKKVWAEEGEGKKDTGRQGQKMEKVQTKNLIWNSNSDLN